MRTRALLPLCLIMFSCSQILLGADEPSPTKDPPALGDENNVELNALEKQFEQTLSGAVLDGTFTITGRGDDTQLQREKYTILKVTKLQADVWVFTARIQYGKRDVTVPIPLQVKWAGDTPVITLTDFPIPGVGTYTARVLIYRGQYAGMWSGKDHGGQLFGMVVPATSDDTQRNAAGKDSAPGNPN